MDTKLLRQCAFFWALGLVAACSPPAPGHLSARIGQASFDLQSASFLANSDDANGLTIVLSDQADFCEHIGSGILDPNTIVVQMRLFSVAQNGETQTPEPGLFALGANLTAPLGLSAWATYIAYDDNCIAKTNSVAGAQAVSGNVTLHSIGNGSLTASINTLFNKQSFFGTFTAAPCPGVANWVSDSFGCQQGLTPLRNE